MVPPIDPTESVAKLFGNRVRRLREARGLTQAQLAQMVHTDPSRITQIERASGSPVTRQMAAQLDALLGADDLLNYLWVHLDRVRYPDWLQLFIRYSAIAIGIREYAAHAVPGLLQTPDYARATLRTGHSLRSEAQLEERVHLRIDRQELFASPNAPAYTVVLDEAVIRRPVGGRAVMREQMTRILACENVTVQVLLFAEGEHPSMGGSLTLLTMPDGREVAYTEGAHDGRLMEDPEEVKAYAMTYDHLRASALPSRVSLDMIRDVWGGNSRDDQGRKQRLRLAQVQLQQPRRGQLRGGGRRPPGPRSGA
ncbi:helix-turn-helix transcriptional regulator [Streptomyces sp. SID3343]|uniref:helix-turn-helix domain-containing protein n=1 Tax=Streptomyces sp. SID3343 TaxID=2690260 RepID=UPI001F29FFCF|nr:helix-turn-helix transcriptional regulator [Streptomyces sp. SID3343]